MPAEPFVATVHIEAEPSRVFEYFVNPDELTKWMGRRAVLDPRPGGEFALDFHSARVRGRFLDVERPRRLVISWGQAGSAVLPPGASTVEVTFSAQAGGTLVTLVHRGLPAVEAARHALGWQHFLRRLERIAGGRDPGPDPWLTSPPPAVTRPAAEPATATPDTG